MELASGEKVSALRARSGGFPSPIVSVSEIRKRYATLAGKLSFRDTDFPPTAGSVIGYFPEDDFAGVEFDRRKERRFLRYRLDVIYDTVNLDL
jgi:hypothetical protein